jgi:sugar-specific transcriptional regulator TrmB
MPDENREPTLAREIREIREIIGGFESLITRLESRLAESQDGFLVLLREGDELVCQARECLSEINEEARRAGIEPLPEIDIPDERMKAAWLVLYQFQDGATADEVAERMRKHRTTVSSTLNSLHQWGFAEKERRGHEIYYRAIAGRTGR